MGERAFDGPATDDDLAVMTAELRSALAAGAAGFTTSRGRGHATSDGRPVASRLADWNEVAALVGVVGEVSSGAFQLAPERYAEPDRQADFADRLRQLAVRTGVPTIFGIFAQDRVPQLTLDVVDAVVAEGGQAWGLTHCRGILSAQSFLTTTGFDSLAEWQDLRRRPHAEQMALLRDPAVRGPLVHAAHHGDYGTAFGPEARRPDFETMTVLEHPWGPNPTVAEVARRRGVDPVDAMIDVALERDLDVFFLQSLVPQDDERLPALMRHPRTAMGFSDSGAHVSQVFDSSIYTHLLAHWVRDRQAITLEEAVSMITARPAAMWRLADRGRLVPGAVADVVVFDPATVGPRMPQVVRDLPGGAPRIEQHADGFAATIVNGQVLLRDGEPTEARPGRLLRAAGRGPR
jgi:N-acyl-D-aspartate/D-glutamate deacylase